MGDGRAEATAAAPGERRQDDDDADLVRVDVVDVELDGLVQVQGALVVEDLTRAANPERRTDGRNGRDAARRASESPKTRSAVPRR